MSDKSANELAEQYFREARALGKKSVLNKDMKAWVEQQSGQSTASVSGTLDGTGTGSVVESPWYTTDWYKDSLANGLIIHRLLSGDENSTVLLEKPYDYPKQREACDKIMSYLPADRPAKVLTVAAAHGNSVIAAFARNPLVQVDNVERRPQVLRLWQARKQQLGLQTTDIPQSLEDFTETRRFLDTKYDLIAIDEGGYSSDRTHKFLEAINRNMSCDYLALTVQKLDGFRNDSPLIREMIAEYGHLKDGHALSLIDRLTNYQHIDGDEYNNGGRSKWLEYFIFRLDPLPAAVAAA